MMEEHDVKVIPLGPPGIKFQDHECGFASANGKKCSSRVRGESGDYCSRHATLLANLDSEHARLAKELAELRGKVATHRAIAAGEEQRMLRLVEQHDDLVAELHALFAAFDSVRYAPRASALLTRAEALLSGADVTQEQVAIAQECRELAKEMRLSALTSPAKAKPSPSGPPKVPWNRVVERENGGGRSGVAYTKPSAQVRNSGLVSDDEL